MGTCGSKFCNCFCPSSSSDCSPEEKLVISKSPPPTDLVLTCHDLFTSSSSLSCSTTAATTATTVSSPSSSSSSLSINSDVVVPAPVMPSDAEMANTVIGCPQGAAVPPSRATGAASKQPTARARKPLRVKRPRSTSPAVRAGPKSYRTEKSPGTVPPRRSSNSPFPTRAGSGGGGALHGRRRCQACSAEWNAVPLQFAARKDGVRVARRPRVSEGARGSSVDLSAACAHQDVDVHPEVHHSEVAQNTASSSETLSRVLVTDELLKLGRIVPNTAFSSLMISIHESETLPTVSVYNISSVRNCFLVIFPGDQAAFTKARTYA